MANADNNSKLELIKKIKALADKGHGGEKINAQKMLDDMMKKYGIKECDICDDTIQAFKIKFSGFKMRELTAQVFYSIVGIFDGEKGIYNGLYKDYYVKCTNAEWIEFQAKLKFYKYHLKKELDIFYTAFIAANNIYPPQSKVTERVNRELTEDDMKAIRLSRNLEKHDYYLQVENGRKKNE